MNTVEIRFVRSLFWLEHDITFDMRITFSDPGDLLDDVSLTGTVSIQTKNLLPPPVNSYFVSPDGSGATCNEAAPCALDEGIN